MMRLPRFRYHAPTTVEEACRILAGEGPIARPIAGGTDLLPNMKRRQQTPQVLVGLRRIQSLTASKVEFTASLGAGLTLSQLSKDRVLAHRYAALPMAAYSVATPHLRNMGTLGGNLCLDTRCNYYDQSFEWRKSIDFCMKKDGKTCWVAPSSPRCWAVSSTDTAPALLALGASVRLVSASGTRDIPLDALYHDDGMAYITRRPDELLTEVLLPDLTGWRSTYLKCRRRGSFDFPILSVGAAACLDGRTIRDLRLVLGAVASRPLVADTKAYIGQTLDDATIETIATAVAKLAHPLDNTDLNMNWRKRVAREYVAAALREVRGDGPQAVPTGHVPLTLLESIS